MENLQQTKHMQSILVTSTRTYVNNASIAADLAAMVAQSGKKTVLMDADLNRPVIHRVFELPNRVGLSDVLQGQRTANAIMHSMLEGNLHIITSGSMPSMTKDLIGTKEMSALIKQLISAEDGKKPLSDSQLSEILGQQGIVVARRTVAKYRESLNIPPVNLRKTL